MANVYMGTDVEDFIFGEATYEEACSSKKEEVEAKEENADVGDIEVDVETDKDGKIDTQANEEIKEAVEAEMNACGVMECVDDPEVACYRIALENEQNYNMILHAFMEMEIATLESTGVEMVYEESKINTFFTAIQKAIDKFWQKVQGIFKSVMTNISKFTDSNAAFVKKYGNSRYDIVKPGKEFNMKGYNFTDTIPLFVKVTSSLEGIYDKIKFNAAEYDAETKKNEFRSFLCGKASGTVSADTFSDELKIAFYGSKEKVDISLPDFSSLIVTLGSGKFQKNTVKKMYKNCKDTVSGLKKKVKEVEKNTQGDQMAAAKQLTTLINSSLSMMSKALSVKISAINSELIQSRVIAAFYIRNQPKEKKEEKKVAGESFTIEDLGVTLI